MANVFGLTPQVGAKNLLSQQGPATRTPDDEAELQRAVVQQLQAMAPQLQAKGINPQQALTAAMQQAKQVDDQQRAKGNVPKEIVQHSPQQGFDLGILGGGGRERPKPAPAQAAPPQAGGGFDLGILNPVQPGSVSPPPPEDSADSTKAKETPKAAIKGVSIPEKPGDFKGPTRRSLEPFIRDRANQALLLLKSEALENLSEGPEQERKEAIDALSKVLSGEGSTAEMNIGKRGIESFVDRFPDVETRRELLRLMENVERDIGTKEGLPESKVFGKREEVAGGDAKPLDSEGTGFSPTSLFAGAPEAQREAVQLAQGAAEELNQGVQSIDQAKDRLRRNIEDEFLEDAIRQVEARMAQLNQPPSTLEFIGQVLTVLVSGALGMDPFATADFISGRSAKNQERNLLIGELGGLQRERVRGMQRSRERHEDLTEAEKERALRREIEESKLGFRAEESELDRALRSQQFDAGLVRSLMGQEANIAGTSLDTGTRERALRERELAKMLLLGKGGFQGLLQQQQADEQAAQRPDVRRLGIAGRR